MTNKLILMLMILLGGPVHGEPSKLSLRDAQLLASAIRTLDSHQIVKDGAVVATVPYELGSGTIRIKLANDLSILKLSENAIETARQQIVRELMAKHNVAKIDNGTVEFEEFLQQMNAALDQPAPGTQDLVKIKIEDLKLDKNEIPLATLSGLKPIIEEEAKP